MAGSESSFYDDSGFAPVTVPHAVTPLSWRYWNAQRVAAAVDLPAPLQRRAAGQLAPAGQPDHGRIRRGHGQRDGRDQRPAGGHPPGRVPAVLGRAHRPRHLGRQPALGPGGRQLPAGAADELRPRAEQRGLLPAGRDLPGRQAAGAPPGVPIRRVRPAGRRAQLAAAGGRGVHHRLGTADARRRQPAGRAVRRSQAGRRAGRAGQPGHARRHDHDAEPDRTGADHPVVDRQPQAVHGAGHAGLPRRGQPRPVPADRVPGRVVPARRLLPERRAAAAVRPEPAPALPVRRHGDASPGPADGRGDPEERAQLQHGPLLALPAVAALPRRLRRARAAGLGRGPGLAQRERRPGLAGPGGAERARHGEAGPEPAVGRHLGHPAQRDTRPPGPVGRHQAGRRPARRLAAQFGGDGLPPGHRVERGRLRLQRLHPRPGDR